MNQEVRSSDGFLGLGALVDAPTENEFEKAIFEFTHNNIQCKETLHNNTNGAVTSVCLLLLALGERSESYMIGSMINNQATCTC